MVIERVVEQIRDACDVADVKGAFRSCSETFGFVGYSFMVVVPGSTEAQAFVAWSDWPDGYRDVASGERSASSASSPDPVMRALRWSSMPIAWDQEIYAAAGADDMYEVMTAHGVASGVAQAAHLRGGWHLAAGFLRREREVTSREQVLQVQALQTVVSVVVDSARDVLFPVAIEAINGKGCGQDSVFKALGFTLPKSELSPREQEALQWAAAGKTAWEISVITSASERTVEKHLASAITKLGCVNRPQAVAVALRKGLIR